jgi:hypothetical protein
MEKDTLDYRRPRSMTAALVGRQAAVARPAMVLQDAVVAGQRGVGGVD